ncbi:MAG TPA: TRAM domain-containing protein, partial [Thermoanaerobaculia bacterium]|nr:TRAM domain-containing protein [Thermoanaerobaculia bacterium]
MRDRREVALRLAALDEVEVTVEKLVAGGDGLARVDGIPIFVARSAPGDRVRVRLVERRPDYGRAEIVELLAPGPGRREPPCPYFTDCGGCQLQHIEDALQVRYKAEAVVETLSRVGGVKVPPSLEVVAGEAWGYRLRTQLHTGRDAQGNVQVGYFARGSHTLVPVNACPILDPALEAQIPTLPERLGEGEIPSRLDLLVGDDGALSAAPVVEELPHGDVPLTVGDFSYRLDARCFFQAHRTLVSRLMTAAVGRWEGAAAVDLYAGVGLFTLPLGRRYRSVVAVEGDRVSARYARGNAKRHRLPHVAVVPQAVESWVGQLPSGLDRVLVDPPRDGLATPVRKALLLRLPERITYVSCHAATLARDLRELLTRYRLESLALFDLFPQS